MNSPGAKRFSPKVQKALATVALKAAVRDYAAVMDRDEREAGHLEAWKNVIAKFRALETLSSPKRGEA